ncbi:MAG: hypothetical protein H7840_11585 [Alphaproteobacteria bacterium]
MATTSDTPHLYVALSSHGYGHAAMTAPVVNRLRALVPGVRLTIETRVPHGWLADRYDGPFAHVDHGRDFGMVMTSATEVDVEASATGYRRLHEDWESIVAVEAKRLAAAAPDLILANVSHVTLAAAARARIPAVAFCSLNWAGIYRHYCGHRPEAGRILGQMEEAYASALVFLRPLPAMPMPGFANRRDIGPVARLGRDRRRDLERLLGVGEGTRIGLLAFGGIDPGLNTEAWPRHPGWMWMSGRADEPVRPDVVTTASLPLPFADLLRSSDLLVTKPGYGTFAEAGCLGLPVLYARRDDWPEEPHLGDWLKRHTRALAVDGATLRSGDIGAALASLLAQPAPVPATPSGIDEAAEVLARHLG